MTEGPSGWVVVSRPGFIGSGKRRRPLTIWKLHEPDCAHLEGASVMPAPDPLYPDTEDCRYCAPRSEHRPRFTVAEDGTSVGTCRCGLRSVGPNPDAARNKLMRMHRPSYGQPRVQKPGHRTEVITQPDGSILLKCECGESGVGPNVGAARNQVYRRHKAAGI
jgi:hypothetical protein